MDPGGQGADACAEGEASDPYRRPARRTQWLLSALAHHYGLDRGVENEIVVLATGLDQYLQEVFHHLDCRGAGRLPRADFRALCAVLGLRAEGAAAPGDVATGVATDRDEDVEEEASLVLRTEPPELTFRQFHARLCGYFCTRAGSRLPRGVLSEHIETQIRLRRPRRRRPPCSPNSSAADGERVARLEEENGSLRELVEDLRAALQSSDARCLALQVGLWKNQAEDREVDRGESEAAARELRQARGAAAAAEARAGLLRRGQAEMRRRAEKARQAVLLSLPRVRELEALARQVPDLRCCVQRLEAELRGYRLERPTLQRVSPEPRDESGQHEDSGAQGPSPGGAWPADSSSRAIALDEASRASSAGDMEDQLFRSVEGQAASDQEEEEAKVCCEGQRSPASLTKTLLAQLSSCMSRPDDQTAQKLRTHFGHFGGADHTHALGELEAHVAMLVEKNLGIPGEAEPEWKKEENEHLRLELQVVETERVRLSLMEEKLVDVLQLLQRLRDLNISKRALGKILLSTLDACRDPAHERRAGPSATLDALYQALAGCKLLQGQPSTPTSAPAVLNNPLLISC